MKKAQSFRLLGFVPLGLDKPCFLLPVFGTFNRPFVQSVNSENKILGFQACYLNPATIIIADSHKTLRYRIGDSRLCAFRFPDGQIVMGSEAKVASALQPRLDGLRSYRCLDAEVHEFLKEFGSTDADKVTEKKAKPQRMTQTQIFQEMANKTGISKQQVKDFITAFTDLAYREAKKGEFAIPGLGKLVKQKRKARIGRNPATGEEIKVPATKVLHFRVAKAARNAVLRAKK